MKTRIRHLILLVPFCLQLACSSERTLEPLSLSDYWGTVSALRNGIALQNPKIWAATRTPCNKDAFDIYVTEFDAKGNKLAAFSLANVPLRTGKMNQFKADDAILLCQTDTIGTAFAAWTPDGHEDTYKPARLGNQLVITEYDSVKQEIKGTFFLQLGLDRHHSSALAQTMRIDAGTFHTKLKGPDGKYR